MTQKENKEEHLAPADLKIIVALKEAPEGLRINQISRNAKISPNYLRKRLLKLRLAFIVKRTFKSRRSSQVIYKLTNFMASSKDLELIDLAISRFFSLKKINELNNKLEANIFIGKFSSEKVKFNSKILKREYSEFYSYHLWCLYHASQAENKYVQRQIIRFYLFWIKTRINNMILCQDEKFRTFYEELNEATFPELDKEHKKHLLHSKQQLISFLPKPKQELASDLFDFWSQSDNPLDILEFFKDIINNNFEKEKFEKFHKKQVTSLEIENIRDIISRLLA